MENTFHFVFIIPIKYRTLEVNIILTMNFEPQGYIYEGSLITRIYHSGVRRGQWKVVYVSAKEHGKPHLCCELAVAHSKTKIDIYAYMHTWQTSLKLSLFVCSPDCLQVSESQNHFIIKDSQSQNIMQISCPIKLWGKEKLHFLLHSHMLYKLYISYIHLKLLYEYNKLEFIFFFLNLSCSVTSVPYNIDGACHRFAEGHWGRKSRSTQTVL